MSDKGKKAKGNKDAYITKELWNARVNRHNHRLQDIRICLGFINGNWTHRQSNPIAF